MIPTLKRFLTPRPRAPRLWATEHGFDIRYPGLLRLHIRWDNVEAVRASRREQDMWPGIWLEFVLAPGKLRKIDTSEAWPGFADVCLGAKRALPLAPSDWRTLVRAPGSEALLFQRSAPGLAPPNVQPQRDDERDP